MLLAVLATADPSDSTMTDTHDQASEVTILWRLGDPWRDLRDEIAASPVAVWAITGHGSLRGMHPAEHWQVRIPDASGARIAGDRMQTELSAITAATPCGVTTWGDGPESWSSSTTLLLLATGVPEDWPAIRAGMTVEDFHATFDSHPPDGCGARLCRRER